MPDELRFIKFEYGKKVHDVALEALLSEYFDDLFSKNPEENVPKEKLPLVVKLIGENTLTTREWAYFCQRDKEFIGFSIFQIDEKSNANWCKREGFGMIGEFYIQPHHRRKGYARLMYAFSEDFLKKAGVTSLYLTADSEESLAFWRAVGYADSGEIDDTNGGKIFEKRLG